MSDLAWHFIGLAIVLATIPICWWLTRRQRFWCTMRGGYCEKQGRCPRSTDCWAGRR